MSSHSPEAQSGQSGDRDVVYVSWGGTGRGEALRAALGRAVEIGQGLKYLAILDEHTFDDLDQHDVDLVVEELRWLLESQLRMAVSQSQDPNMADLRTSIEVRQGDVEDEILDAVRAANPSLVLLGAPLPRDVMSTRRSTIEALVAALREQTQADVDIVGPGT